MMQGWVKTHDLSSKTLYGSPLHTYHMIASIYVMYMNTVYIYIYQNIFIQCVQSVVQDTYYIYAQVLDHRFRQKWGTRKTSSDSVPPTYPQKTPQSTMA